jgi:hypothetical protein
MLVGAIDVASDMVETPEDVASVVAEVIKHVPKERIQLCTNCGIGAHSAATSPSQAGRAGQGRCVWRGHDTVDAKRRHGSPSRPVIPEAAA